MTDLRYEAPDNLSAALALLSGAKGITRLLAGGTDVIVQMEMETIEPELIVDIKRIPELLGIKAEGGGWRIGAATSGMVICDHKDFARAWPGVIEGVKLIGSIQVKGRASIGGNLCNASPGADSVPPLITAGAIARVVGPKCVREVPVEQVCTGPGKTSLAKDELIASFFFPARPKRSGDAYQRFTPRTEMDIAVTGCAVNLTLDDKGICSAARVAIGAVAPTALLVAPASAALVGTRVDDAAIEKMVTACRAACKPIDDKRGTKAFRIEVTGVLAKRVAKAALARAQSS